MVWRYEMSLPSAIAPIIIAGHCEYSCNPGAGVEHSLQSDAWSGRRLKDKLHANAQWWGCIAKVGIVSTSPQLLFYKSI
jgi:hypothetical protein